ncbi:MAG: HAMP domain-containing sensor histidine kinase, partial [Chitinophaga rupis]
DKHIQRTKDAVKHLNDLLEDFLSLGRLEEGKVSPEPAGFPLRDFLEELTEEMQSLAKPDQAIHCPYTDGQVLYTDKRLLKNTLVTLLSNAIKFSAEGAPIYLETVHLPGEMLRITVRDNGIGISDEDQQHLFSSFFRGTNAVNIDGTGLGLHIARRYMDLLQGSISIQSAVDAGTTVTIELPEKLA